MNVEVRVQLVLFFHHIGPGSLYPLSHFTGPDPEIFKAQTYTNIATSLLPNLTNINTFLLKDEIKYEKSR